MSNQDFEDKSLINIKNGTKKKVKIIYKLMSKFLIWDKIKVT